MRVRGSTCMIVLVGAMLLTTMTGAAWATRPVVVDGGGAGRIELGDASVDAIVFLTLRKGQTFTVTVTGDPGDPVRVRLFVPDQLPERNLQEAELPTVSLAGNLGMPAAWNVYVPATGGERQKEPSTGIRLREVLDTVETETESGAGASRLQFGPDGARSIKVAARDDARVALVVGPEDEIVIPDAARQPRTVARIRDWYDTAPDGSRSTSGAAPRVPSRAWLVAPIAVVIAMLALTAWWMLLGSTIGRRRGIERAAERRALAERAREGSAPGEHPGDDQGN